MTDVRFYIVFREGDPPQARSLHCLHGFGKTLLNREIQPDSLASFAAVFE
jgi:hypothetical protein